MRGPVGNGAVIKGHHSAHIGFWSGKEEYSKTNIEKYVLCKSNKALARITDPIMIINRDASFEIQYRIREKALNHSLKREKITSKQHSLRMIKLEESMAVHSYRMGEYDSEHLEEAKRQFEGRRLMS